MQGHVQSLDNDAEVLAVRHGVVVDVVVALVGDALRLVQRRVNPVQSDAVGRLRAGAQLHGCREITAAGRRCR